MGLFSRTQGQAYETRAAQFLASQGLDLIAQNVYCKGGEIDLIACHQDTLIFIEVKYRKNAHYGNPIEFISPQKQHKLQRCAQVFLQKNRRWQKHPIRFDVVAFCGEGTEPQWIQNAFGGW